MPTTDQDYDSKCKIVILGKEKAGKTAFIRKEVDNKFNSEYHATIGVEFATKIYEHDNKKIKAWIWDTAGQERYRSIISAYLKDVHGAIICVRLDEPIDKAHETYLNNQIKQLQVTSPSALITLVGTKSDSLNADSNYLALQAFAGQNGCECAKSSAKKNENITETMQTLITAIADKQNSELAAKLAAESAEQHAFRQACLALNKVLKKSPKKVQDEINGKTNKLIFCMNSSMLTKDHKQQMLTSYLNTCLKLSGSSLLSKCIKTVVVTGVCVVFGVAAAMGICLSLGIGAGVIGIGLAAVATGTLAFGVSSAAFFKDNALQKSIKDVGLTGKELVEKDNPSSTPKQ